MAHKNTSQLVKELNEAKRKIDISAKYFHYKHPENLYKILTIGFIEATETVSVVYQSEHGDKFVWVRPVEEFLSKAKLPDGTEVDRFTKVE